MNKFAEITVFELFNGKTPETIESDNDYRSGTITQFVLKSARIRWDDAKETDDVEYVKTSLLHKVDKDTYVLTRQPIADVQAKTDIVPLSDILPKVAEQFVADKAAETKPTPAKRTSRTKAA